MVLDLSQTANYTRQDTNSTSSIITSNNTNNSNYSYDVSYAPIFNLNSPDSSISSATKKEMSASNTADATQSPKQSTEQAPSNSMVNGLTTKNLIILGLIGAGAYFLLK